CSFCFQRLQSAKLEAKKQDRPLKDGDAKTACQTACSANAIVFGNVHAKDSAITKARAENTQRGFYVLEQLHVLPNVSYLAKVRNTAEIIEPEGHHGPAKTEHAAGQKEEKKAEEAHH